MGCGGGAAVQPPSSLRFLTYTRVLPVPPHSPKYHGAQSAQKGPSAHQELMRPWAKYSVVGGYGTVLGQLATLGPPAETTPVWGPGV